MLSPTHPAIRVQGNREISLQSWNQQTELSVTVSSSAKVFNHLADFYAPVSKYIVLLVSVCLSVRPSVHLQGHSVSQTHLVFLMKASLSGTLALDIFTIFTVYIFFFFVGQVLKGLCTFDFRLSDAVERQLVSLH